MARIVVYCDQNHSNAVIEQIVAACGGDMASAIQALLSHRCVKLLKFGLKFLIDQQPAADQTLASLTFCSECPSGSAQNILGCIEPP